LRAHRDEELRGAVVVQQRDLYLRRDGDVWSWYLTLTRQPVR
jgi:hypothetical protein